MRMAARHVETGVKPEHYPLVANALTDTSKMQLSIPRDRAGTFDPKLIAKYHAASAELLDDGSIEITFA